MSDSLFDDSVSEVPELIVNRLFFDERGTFQEMYSAPKHKWPVAQVNHSYSVVGTIRGMHWQIPPADIYKYVTVVLGRIEDVVVDLRLDSKTFGRWHKYVLSDGVFEGDAHGWERENYRASLYVPSGFAHGFGVLTHQAHVVYMQNKPYCPKSERSFNPEDPNVGIFWRTSNWTSKRRIISEKDKAAPLLKDVPKHDLFF